MKDSGPLGATPQTGSVEGPTGEDLDDMVGEGPADEFKVAKEPKLKKATVPFEFHYRTDEDNVYDCDASVEYDPTTGRIEQFTDDLYLTFDDDGDGIAEGAVDAAVRFFQNLGTNPEYSQSNGGLYVSVDKDELNEALPGYYTDTDELELIVQDNKIQVYETTD